MTQYAFNSITATKPYYTYTTNNKVTEEVYDSYSLLCNECSTVIAHKASVLYFVGVDASLVRKLVAMHLFSHHEDEFFSCMVLGDIEEI